MVLREISAKNERVLKEKPGQITQLLWILPMHWRSARIEAFVRGRLEFVLVKLDLKASRASEVLFEK